MSTPTPSFAELHRLHLALQEVQEQLDRGPRQIRAREQLVTQAEADVATRREQLKSQRMSNDRKTLDLKTNEAKIADLRGKLNAASSNREFDIIKGQIDADTVANSVLQDEILELLDSIDRTQSEIKNAEQKVAKSKEELQRFSTQFAADSTGLRTRAEELSGRVKQSESGLTGDLAERYRRLVEAYGAAAMAPCENGICGNCRVQVTPQSRVKLNAGNVLFCGACGRMLYKPPE
jgi:predicted  nucleic acid-binding Zn-ribbon protein